MSALSSMFVHSATVETFTGSGAYGDTYAAPVTVVGFLDNGLVLTKTGTIAEMTVKSTFYADLADAAKFTPGTQVTVNGYAGHVTQSRIRDGGTLGLPDHVEVDLS